MRVVLQRVKQAQVQVASEIVGQIGRGILVFLSVAKDDIQEDADYLITKVTQLRMFEDAQGKMN